MYGGLEVAYMCGTVQILCNKIAESFKLFKHRWNDKVCQNTDYSGNENHGYDDAWNSSLHVHSVLYETDDRINEICQ